MTAWDHLKKSFSLKEIITLIVSLACGLIIGQIGRHGSAISVVCVLAVLALFCLILITHRMFNLETFANNVEGAVGSLDKSLNDAAVNMNNLFRVEADRITKSIQKLEDTYTIQVTYIDRENKESEISLFEAIKVYVDLAQKSIIIVNSYLVEHSSAYGRESQMARDGYYKALIRKAESGVEYKRIVQVKPDNSTLVDMTNHNEDHIRHFEEMLNCAEARPNISLKKAPPRRLSTFMLVDEKYLIWQINELRISNKQENIRLHGAFLIEDPQKKIISHFLKYYQALDAKSDTMTRYDIRNLS